jgi:hypothetical protein
MLHLLLKMKCSNMWMLIKIVRLRFLKILILILILTTVMNILTKSNKNLWLTNKMELRAKTLMMRTAWFISNNQTSFPLFRLILLKSIKRSISFIKKAQIFVKQLHWCHRLLLRPDLLRGNQSKIKLLMIKMSLTLTVKLPRALLRILSAS